MANKRLRKEMIETVRGLYDLGVVEAQTVREINAKFVGRAGRKEVLAQTTAAVKVRNQDVSYTRLQAIIDESVARVRNKGRTRHRRS